MVKTAKYTFKGMNQDIVDSKVPMEFFYSANNIRFNTTDEVVTGGVAFEKGNSEVVTLPTVVVATNQITYNNKTISYSTSEITPGTYSTHKIIGYSVTRNSTILITTDDAGFDCFWEVNNENYDLTLLYVNNLNLSTAYPIQTIFNYENENIQKVYWIDGKEQIRFINIKHDSIEGNEPLIDLPANTLNFVGNINLTQPKIARVSSGGNHTAGVIQYAYNLYRLNSSQTKISPFSELVALDKGSGQGGGAVDEVVASIPVVEIEGVDNNYTHIKVYAIKYTSFNQIPSVSLIEEREIGNSTTVTVSDDGSIIETISIEELLLLGSNPITPQHIEAKDNILFPINIKENFFDVDLDTRAYSWSAAQTCFIYDNIRVNSNGTPVGTGKLVSSVTYNVPEKHDAVNLNYDFYKYQQDGVTPGGEGKFLKYELVQKTAAQLNGNVEDLRFLKR